MLETGVGGAGIDEEGVAELADVAQALHRRGVEHRQCRLDEADVVPEGIADDLEWEGLDGFTAETFTELMGVDTEAWKQEILGHEMLFERLYDRLPKEFLFMRELILSSLWRSPEHWRLADERDDED